MSHHIKITTNQYCVSWLVLVVDVTVSIAVTAAKQPTARRRESKEITNISHDHCFVVIIEMILSNVCPIEQLAKMPFIYLLQQHINITNSIFLPW